MKGEQYAFDQFDYYSGCGWSDPLAAECLRGHRFALGTSCQEVMTIELIEIRLTWRCCMLHGSNATLLLHATPFLLKSTTFDGSHLAISIYTY
jgi:hypothetical protein